MRIVVVSDIHVHKWAEFDHIDSTVGTSARLNDCLSVLRQVLKYAKTHAIRNVVINGDLFHKMGIIDVETFNLTHRVLRLMKSAGLVVWLNRGNHDYASRDGTVHSLETFGDICVVPGNTARTMHDETDSIDTVFVPYSDNREEILERLKCVTGIPLAFMHHGFRGAAVGSTLEYIVKEPLEPEEVGKHFGMVYSGHYHRLQFVHDNVMYVGSPLEHTRSDIGEDPKGFIVINTNDIKNPEFVEVKAPRFIRMDGSLQPSRPVEGNFIDYQLDKGEDTEEVRAKLIKRGARGLKLLPYVPPAAKAAHRATVNASMSMEDIVKACVKKRGGTLDHTRLEKMMLDTLREAQK